MTLIEKKTIYCPYCGAILKVDERTQFCQYCGKPLIIDSINLNEKTINMNINQNVNHREEFYDESKVKASEYDTFIQMKKIELKEKEVAYKQRITLLKILFSVVIGIVGIISSGSDESGGKVLFLACLAILYFIWKKN